jgi:hypothetical protein
MIMNDQPRTGLSDDELAAQGATALPDKEVVSILDLNADIDLAIDAAAPIDLAVAANANVAAPIDAAVGANILSEGSSAQALSDQGVMIDQGIQADAAAHAVQDSGIDQADAAGADDAPAPDAAAPSAVPTDLPDGVPTEVPGDVPTDVSDVGGTAGSTLGSLDGSLLDVDVNVDAANIGSVDSDAVAVSQQDAIINQDITGSADATSDQSSEIQQ